VETVSKPTLSSLAVSILRQLNVASKLIVGSFPTKSFVVGADSLELTVPARTGFAEFSLVAQIPETGIKVGGRFNWQLALTPFAVTGGTGAVYAAIAADQKAMWDAVLNPTPSLMTLEGAIALALEATPLTKAAVVCFDQLTNTLTVAYGTEAQLDTFKAAVAALTPTPDKQWVGVEFEDVLPSDITGTFLE
jgi:hypothetical protein